MICVSLLLLINAIYCGGGFVGLASEKCLIDCSIYLCVMFEYVCFPIGICGTFVSY